MIAPETANNAHKAGALIPTVAFGILGFWMKQGGWPRPPLILALVLGGLMENNFQLTTQIYGDYEWLYNRPIVVVIEILVVATVLWAFYGRLMGLLFHPSLLFG